MTLIIVVHSNVLMMSPLPNVRQAYSLVMQEETQRGMSSESIEIFSTAATVQSHPINFSNKLKNKYCEHCNREGHTIENCRTLKFHCNYCDKKGHTEDRCKFKNGTWASNKSNNQNGQQPSRRGQGNLHNTFPSANAMDSSQTSHGIHTQENNSSSHGLFTSQLQQIAHTLSMITQTNATGNVGAYANAAGSYLFPNISINSVFSKPWILDTGATDHIASDSTLFTKIETPSIPIVNLPH